MSRSYAWPVAIYFIFEEDGYVQDIRNSGQSYVLNPCITRAPVIW